QVLQHLLLGGDYEAIVDPDRLDAAFGARDDPYKTPARDAFHFHASKFRLRLLHLRLHRSGGFLRRLHHFFDRLHGLDLCRLSSGSSSLASGKAARAAFTTGSSRMRASLSAIFACSTSPRLGRATPSPGPTCQRVPVAWNRASPRSRAKASPS